MYFQNRADAGRQLAQKLIEYQTKNCAVIALNSGGVLVGAQIAIKLHSNLMMLMTEKIHIPGEPTPLAGMSDFGTLIYNKDFSTGEIEEFNAEYFNYIEQERIEKSHKLHMLISAGGMVRKELLRNHIIIVVIDGLTSGLSLDVAADYLKHIKIKKLIVVTPLASVQALDRMRLFADEVHCLSVPTNYVNTDHYYTDNTIPDQKGLGKIIRNISLSWERLNLVDTSSR